MRRHTEASEHGSIMVLAAITATLMVFAAAFAVDISHQSASKRSLHSIADLAAQDAVWALGSNHISANCPGAILPTVDVCAHTAALQSSVRNGFPASLASAAATQSGWTWTSTSGDYALSSTIGTWNAGASPQFQSPEANAAAANCATSDAETDSGGVEYDADCTNDATAVQVTVSQVVHNLLKDGSHTLVATAVARVGRTGVRVGSYGVQADVNNAYLGSFLGLPPAGHGSESISVAGYNGLASAGVTLAKLQAAAGLASPSQLLTTTFKYKDILQIAANAFDPSGSSSAQAAIAMRQLSGDAASNSSTQAGVGFTLGQLITFPGPVASAGNLPCNPTFATTTVPCVNTAGIGNNGLSGAVGEGSAAESQAYVNLLDLVMAAPEAALVDGNNAMSFTMPSSVTIPGVAGLGVNVNFTAIQAPQDAYGPVGTTAQTAQLRAQITLTGSQTVGLSIVNFNIPIDIQGFGGTGVIRLIDCGAVSGTGTPGEVDILGTPSAGTAAIGTDSIITNPLTSVTTGALMSILGVSVLSGGLQPITISTSAQTPFPFTTNTPPNTVPNNPPNNPTSSYNWNTSASPNYRGPLSTPSPSIGLGLEQAIEGTGQVINDAETTTGTKTLLSPSAANFTAADVGISVSGTGIPPGTVIASVQSSNSVTLSNAATATTVNDQVTLGRSSATGLTYLGGVLGLPSLETVLNNVLGNLDSVLSPLDGALGITAAGMSSWNLAFPGTSGSTPPYGLDCTDSMIVQ